MINHPEIKEGSIVKYEGDDYKVIKVWNHDYLQWWLDLIAVNPIINGVNHYREHMSVPSYNVEVKNK